MHASKLLLTLFALVASSAAACTCQKVSNPGLYCGYCEEVKTGWVSDHAYECAKSGTCKDYGKSSRCADDNAYYCDGRDSWKREEEKVSETVQDVKVGKERS
ncbi:hypothetical protein GQ43DRAFT_478879 [Delitschia confertaspora ATCC 74209]|uniref:Uncharacterized protein n=1 Tax=Delitschia confertaspora ATCC 74209 TaxID=1513339 RepID=A0A9P4JW56_9PLEO|nr:hypothetical protein GQ43DRAFT_478879 [Delitschia confertaspora ATCC 74209]